MKIELNRDDLIRLLESQDPYYHVVDNLDLKRYGGLGGNGENIYWIWDYEALNKLSEEEMYNLYKSVKEESSKPVVFDYNRETANWSPMTIDDRVKHIIDSIP